MSKSPTENLDTHSETKDKMINSYLQDEITPRTGLNNENFENIALDVELDKNQNEIQNEKGFKQINEEETNEGIIIDSTQNNNPKGEVETIERVSKYEDDPAGEEFGDFDENVKEPVSDINLEDDKGKNVENILSAQQLIKTASLVDNVEKHDKTQESNKHTSHQKKVSFSEIINPNQLLNPLKNKIQQVEKENSSLKQNEVENKNHNRDVNVKASRTRNDRSNDVPKPSIDNNKQLLNASANVLHDRSNAKVNISNFNVNKPVDPADIKITMTPGPLKPTHLKEKLKLFVTKKTQINTNEMTSTKDVGNQNDSSKRDISAMQKQRIKSSYHLPFDEVSYLEQQLKMAEVDRMRLKADLLSVEESINVLKANINKAKNMKDLRDSQQPADLTENSMLISKLDKMRREQQERTLRIRQKTQTEHDNILKQLVDQNREREERYSIEKKAKLAESIDKIKNRSVNRKKQLLVANKVIKNLMEAEDQTTDYYRYRIDNPKMLNSSLVHRQ